MTEASPKATAGWKNAWKAFRKLEEFLAEPVTTDRDRAGVLQAFEFTYETCWKAFQKEASLQGLEAKSPRQSIQAAFQLGWILAAEEPDWLLMIEDRNLTSHAYREDYALAVFERVRDIHVKNFRAALLRAKSTE